MNESELRKDFERLQALIAEAGANARLLLHADASGEERRRALARLVQFEDIATQLLQQARGHLAGDASRRRVESGSLAPGDTELF